MKITYWLHLRTPKSPSAKRWKVDSIYEGREKATRRFKPPGGSFWIGEYREGLLAKSYEITS